MSTDAMHELRSLGDFSTAGGTESDGPRAQRRLTARGVAYSELRNRNEGSKPLREEERPDSTLRSYFTDRSWGLEILARCFAAVTLAILIAVLAISNGKPVSRWQSSISVNTLVNALTTTASTALICPGQRSIAGLNSFGTGPVDIFIMIFKHLRMVLAYLGAINVVLILLFGPITQATVDLPIRPQQLGPGTGVVPIRTTYQISNPYPRVIALPVGVKSRDGLNSYHYGGTDCQISSAIDLAMAGSRANLSDVQAQCVRGDCAFGPYSTLGVYPIIDIVPFNDIVSTCSRNRACTYTVQELQPRNNPPWRLGDLTVGGGMAGSNSLPSYALWIGSGQVVASSSSNDPDTSDVPDPATLVQAYLIYVANTTGYKSLGSPARSMSIAALKVTLKLCVSQLETSVVNGTTKTDMKVRDTQLKWTMDSSEDVSVTSSGKNYIIRKGALQSLRQYLSTEVFYGYSNIGIDVVTNDPLGTSAADTANVLAGFMVNRTAQEAQNLVKDKMENVATGLTNALRMSGDQNETFSGTASEPVIYISVSFRWLVLPILSVILALVLLVAVMLETHYSGMPAWKTSPIAALLSLGTDASDAIAAQDRSTPLDTRARLLTIQLRSEGKSGWLLHSNGPRD